MIMEVEALHQDHGTVVLFRARSEEGKGYIVATDHGAARNILAALRHNQQVIVNPPPHMVLGRAL